MLHMSLTCGFEFFIVPMYMFSFAFARVRRGFVLDGISRVAGRLCDVEYRVLWSGVDARVSKGFLIKLFRQF
jgi:hypothetical protein